MRAFSQCYINVFHLCKQRQIYYQLSHLRRRESHTTFGIIFSRSLRRDKYRRKARLSVFQFKHIKAESACECIVYVVPKHTISSGMNNNIVGIGLKTYSSSGRHTRKLCYGIACGGSHIGGQSAERLAQTVYFKRRFCYIKKHGISRRYCRFIRNNSKFSVYGNHKNQSSVSF